MVKQRKEREEVEKEIIKIRDKKWKKALKKAKGDEIKALELI